MASIHCYSYTGEHIWNTGKDEHVSNPNLVHCLRD